jgi:tRNA threonylcarbamoyladenosine biosynthesis protein TsaE
MRDHGKAGPVVMEYVSRSPEDTLRIGAGIARNLELPGVVLLRGGLGMGKTTLTRGIARELGVRDPDEVSSPSYTLVHIYEGRCSVYHVDLYRLEGARDIYSIGIGDFIGCDGVTVVEWSERLTGGFPGAVEVDIEDRGGDARLLRVRVPRSGTRRRRGRRGADEIG